MATTVVPVTFEFPCALAPNASRVSVVGPFNGWNSKTHLMTRTPRGHWTITLYLGPGRTIYCFDVDGTYWLDPGDEGRVPNGWGSEYSVRFVRKLNEFPADLHPSRRDLLVREVV
jgi:hypothetical protein